MKNGGLIAGCIAFCAAAVFAQTAETGAIVGRVNTGNAAVVGATVELRSTALPGTRSQLSGADGSYRFPLLPPGQYTLTVTMAGLSSERREGVAVTLAATTTVDMELHVAMTEEVTVNAAAPSIDVTSAVTGISIGNGAMQSLPLPRNYDAAAQIAPGAGNFGGTAFYGSTGLENTYNINGLDTTDVYAGSSSKAVNFDFVDTVEVMSGGLPAEYGRSTGGVLNAITRSGSNHFQGGLFGYTSGAALRSGPKYLEQLPYGQVQYSDVSAQFDYGGSVGGYIRKDRLWFFAAYDRVNERDDQIRLAELTVPGFSVPAGGKIPIHHKSNLNAAKLSFAWTTNQLSDVSIFGDPGETEGALKNIFGPPSTFEAVTKNGGNDIVVHHSAVLGANWTLNALGGRNVQTSRFAGPGASTPLLRDFTYQPVHLSGGLGLYGNSVGDRDSVKADGTGFIASRHTVKFGIDGERLHSDSSTYYSGGDRVRKWCTVALVNHACPANAPVYYDHTTFIDSDLNPVNPLVTRYKTENRSAYVQDSWAVLTNLTINAGFRMERQSVIGGDGKHVLTVNNPAPRFAVMWDPANHGRDKLYAYAGRYFESFTFDMDRDFGGSGGTMFVENLDPTPGDFRPDPAAPPFPGTHSQTYLFTAGAGAIVDPKTRGQCLDEYLLGYDRQFGGAVVGLKGTFRNLARIVEDIAIDPAKSNVILGNPGEGLLKTIPMFNGDFVPTPKPIRRYAGAELHAEKRFDGRSQIFFSYVWSRLYGNYEGPFMNLAYGSQADPNTSVAYDMGDSLVNNYGPLSDDRTHRVKLYGSYRLRSGFAEGTTFALATHWYSGAPLTVLTSSTYAFLSPRGALGRGPSDYEADLHVGYPIRTRAARTELVLDVFNVLNRQAPTALDLDYNGAYGPPCAGIPADLCNGAGGLLHKPGTTQPLGNLTDPRATAPNPHFLKPIDWTGQRTIRIGARLTF